jgi:UDP-N-acetylmuramoylalanine-D-glutamate ligase
LIQKQNELKLYPKNKTVMKIVILGGGESGVGAALLAKSKGYEVFLSDKSALSDKYKEILEQNDIPYEEDNTMRSLFWMPMKLSKALGFLIKLN